jgi:RNA polymerase sigma factor for flagellar operon FliA
MRSALFVFRIADESLREQAMMERSASEQELWEKYSLSKNTEDKNKLVMHYLPAVKRAALRLMPTYRAYCNYDDMVSSGVIGLMDAIEKYDASHGARFETYSAMRIRGNILDSIRSQDWASDSLRRRLKALQRAQRELWEQLGREPSERELAARLHISEAAVRRTLEKQRTFSLVYFEDMAGDSDKWEQSAASADISPEEAAERSALAEMLGGAIDRLAKKERLVISLYYFEEMTQKEIAQVLGVTESRVCQIRGDAIGRLKTVVQRDWTAM